MKLLNKSTHQPWIKGLGLVGSFAIGLSQIAAGDIVNGAGIMLAALSSAGVLGESKGGE